MHLAGILLGVFYFMDETLIVFSGGILLESDEVKTNKQYDQIKNKTNS